MNSGSKSQSKAVAAARPRQHRRFTNGIRKALLEEFKTSNATSQRKFCIEKNVPYSTWQGWKAREDKIMTSKRGNKHATTGGQGHKSMIPFKDELLKFMQDSRSGEKPLQVLHLVDWVKENQAEWLAGYMGTKKSAAVANDSLRRLLLRFAKRHRFTRRAS
ncbi:hypothetical protein DYB28_014654 [Aphanomyces astaci]|uniref:HTH CENPB-type domain-containing protein n=1 Tax=Aphanomyces astaci TaxID=112090 RepID=A0A397BW41_APHAT|nr:hypothetical protein DYB36_009796 [Aphanomyces astaci]RHY29241.1 hypothetical protein DYB25_008711 [Aphanomyces astaci]RHY55151.1 hypothetical protein DYB34_011380 [Aphanomyces astaci]RHY72872.1 hypothetical protein DYB30_011664 [Aphanomyces astaci]RHY77945.1 hypothetical protein DYB38_002317 [Aphanomyces astaci]